MRLKVDVCKKGVLIILRSRKIFVVDYTLKKLNIALSECVLK